MCQRYISYQILPYLLRSVWLVKGMIVICTLFFSVQPVPECYENNDCQRNEDICTKFIEKAPTLALTIKQTSFN